jgi:2-enoate reductase
MAFETLFQPIKIGPVEIKNRLAAAPMNTMFSENTGGIVNEQILAYYAARAKGGVGLVITEAILGTKLAARFPAYSNLILHDQRQVPGLAELAETCHVYGAKVFAQLSPGFGRQGASPIGEPSPAPSAGIPYLLEQENMPRAFASVFTRLVPQYQGPATREMSVEEIQSEIEEYANTAFQLVMAGFDGMEIHAPHGYLLMQFLSPRTNKRTDQYGGTLENRMRFLVDLVTAVKNKVPPDFPVGIRVSADEHMPEGITLDEMKIVAKKLEELGIAYIHMSSGSYEAFKWLFPDKDGVMLDEAKAFKEVVNIPIITPAIHDPVNAEQAVKDGKTDMISLGRALFADPEWPNKVKEGRVGEITRCIRDYFCILRFLFGLPVRCSQNPNLGREKYMPEYWRPGTEKGEEMLPRLLRKKPAS